MNAAQKLFSTRGFHQTAMADLAKEAQVSVGAIYRAYASKADIILAIIIAGSHDVMSELQGIAERVRTGEIPVEVAIEGIILRRITDKDEALTHEIMAEGHRNPQVAATISDFCVAYRRAFAELARTARPTLSAEELEGATEILMACLFGLGHRGLTCPSLDETTTAKVATRLIMAALRGDC